MTSRTFFPRISLALFTLWACCTQITEAYRYGDYVSMMQRANLGAFTSGWSQIIGRDAPRFGVDKTIKSNPFPDFPTYKTTDPFKLSFSFADEKFITPWITVADGTGLFLNTIEFEFTYYGTYLVGVNWKLDYATKSTTQLPDGIYVTYHWHEQTLSNTALGFQILIIGFVVCTSLATVCVVLGVPSYKSTSVNPSSSSAPFAADHGLWGFGTFFASSSKPMTTSTTAKLPLHTKSMATMTNQRALSSTSTSSSSLSFTAPGDGADKARSD